MMEVKGHRLKYFDDLQYPVKFHHVYIQNNIVCYCLNFLTENTVKYSNMQSNILYLKGSVYAVNLCIIYGEKTHFYIIK